LSAMDWFFDWLTDHQARVRHPHWVDPGDVAYYLGWVDFFDKERVTEKEAYALTRLLQVSPPRYPDRTPEAILAILPGLREEASGGGPLPGSRDEAIARSLGCLECQGIGFSIRYGHAEEPSRLTTSGGATIPPGLPVSSPCGSCELGQYLSRSVAGPGRPAHTWRDVPAFAVGPVDWSPLPDNRHRYRPTEWDAAAGRPSIAPHGTGGNGPAKDPRRLVASLTGLMRHQGEFVPPPPRSPARGEARAVPARSEMADPAPDPGPDGDDAE
jgi:hypothetical protein